MRLLTNKDPQLLITEISENEIKNLNDNRFFSYIYAPSLILHSLAEASDSLEGIPKLGYFFR